MSKQLSHFLMSNTVFMNPKILVQLLCCLLSFLFIYTGASKLLSLHEFTNTLQHAPLLSSLALVLAISIPVVELWIAVLLLFPHTQFGSLYASLFLLSGFTIYILLMKLFGIQLPCTCGGVISKMSWNQHLLFNLFFILLAVTAIILCMHQNRASRKPVEKSRRHFLF